MQFNERKWTFIGILISAHVTFAVMIGPVQQFVANAPGATIPELLWMLGFLALSFGVGGVVLGQGWLIAMWAALGRSRAALRIPAAILTLLGLLLCYWLGASLARGNIYLSQDELRLKWRLSNFSEWFMPFGFADALLVMLVQGVTVYAVACIARKAMRHRLGKRDNSSTRAPMFQIRLRSILLAMLVIGLLLTAGKAIYPALRTSGLKAYFPFWDVLIPPTLIHAIVSMPMLAYFAQRAASDSAHSWRAMMNGLSVFGLSCTLELFAQMTNGWFWGHGPHFYATEFVSWGSMIEYGLCVLALNTAQVVTVAASVDVIAATWPMAGAENAQSRSP